MVVGASITACIITDVRHIKIEQPVTQLPPHKSLGADMKP